ncbi:MAG: F0F1 ATP synthase subunit gamma [Burkholderiaceae bacterium]
MSESLLGLRRQIDSAGDLQGVVRTMRAMAAASIQEYRMSVLALGAYHRAVELGLGACLRDEQAGMALPDAEREARRGPIVAIVFGADQGLVGAFNDVVVDHVVHTLQTLGALDGAHEIWAVGERVHTRLSDAGLTPRGPHAVPASVQAIGPLVDRIQIDAEAHRAPWTRLLVFHNQPTETGLYTPVDQQLLPLDERWRQHHVAQRWPTKVLPEVMGPPMRTLRLLVRELLFISLFRACAESLASENASRLAAMERADKNIDELLADLRADYQRLRQGAIDEELFDVIAGFEALSTRR